MILCILFLMECTCSSQNLISDVLLCFLIPQLLWNIENSNQLPQQLKHMRTKCYIYVIPEYRVPWIEIYKYPLPDTCTRWGMRVYLHCASTNLWNFYTKNRLFIPLQHATWLKYLRRPPIWYTYPIKGTCICRAMEHSILELHR
jgi:hypothetical protein